MKSVLAVSLLLSVACAILVPRKADYDGYKVVRLEVGEHLPKVQSLIKKLSLSTWNGGPKEDSTVDVVVPAGVADDFDIEVADLSPHVMHANLGASIAQENAYPVYRSKLPGCFLLNNGTISSDRQYLIVGSANATWFNAYHPYADHVQFLKDLQATYSANSEIVIAGTSLQGRPITGIHIYGNGGKGSKPAVVFHGTVHAREWITTMVLSSHIREDLSC